MAEKETSMWGKLVKWAFDVADIAVCTFAIVSIVCTFILMKFDVSGSSMLPTLENGDRLFVFHFMYEPKRGDIVTIKDPGHLNKNIIKRVIAKGGDKFKIDLDAGKVWVNGKILDEPYIKDVGKGFGRYKDGGNWDYPDVIPNNMYFCMGDNRDKSKDCRSFGCIPQNKIESKVKLRFWPLNKFGGVN